MANTKITALTNYTTPDGVNDVIPIVDIASTQTKKITRNNFLGITGLPVGTTDTQVLTNKTLTTPTINNPVLGGTVTGTYTLAGTPTFPSAVVTLTGAQTLTNKILTSPTINTATIVNPTITADSISGFSVSTNGTIYGVGITAGVITGANSVSPAALASGIQTTKFSNPYKFSVYRNAAQNLTAGVATKIAYDTRFFDTGSNFDITTNNRFVAPVAGFWHFDVSFLSAGIAGNTRTLLSLYKNGVEVLRGSDITYTAGNAIGLTTATTIQLAATDYVEVFVNGIGGALPVATAGSLNIFSGFLVSTT
jgi:C1q domain